MSVTLTDEQYGTIWRALTQIACGRFGPNNQRLSREAAITSAREACDLIGWPYDGMSVAAANGALPSQDRGSGS